MVYICTYPFSVSEFQYKKNPPQSSFNKFEEFCTIKILSLRFFPHNLLCQLTLIMVYQTLYKHINFFLIFLSILLDLHFSKFNMKRKTQLRITLELYIWFITHFYINYFLSLDVVPIKLHELGIFPVYLLEMRNKNSGWIKFT